MLTDDLAPLLVSQTTAGTRYGLGEIIAWNPDTFENTILWNGVQLSNLRLLGGTDALSYTPGNVLMLMGIDASGAAGFTQWIILGRLFTPGTDNTESLIDFLRGSLAREISAEIFAERIDYDFNVDYGTRTSTTYGDLTGTEVGPSVVDFEVSEAGVAIVQISAANQRILFGTSADPTHYSGLTSFEVTGATSVTADDTRSIRSTVDGTPETNQFSGIDTNSTQVVLTGLNPGLHTATMKYRRWEAVGVDQIQVGERAIVVTAF